MFLHKVAGPLESSTKQLGCLNFSDRSSSCLCLSIVRPRSSGVCTCDDTPTLKSVFAYRNNCS